MVPLSTLARIRQERHSHWLDDLRRRVQCVAGACLDQGLGVEAVLLFGSRARGDFDGHSDIDLIAVGTSVADAEAVADALAEAHLGDDLIPLSLEDWQAKACSGHPTWRAIHAEALPLFLRQP